MTTDPTSDDVTALGSLLAGEVDGQVDVLAAYILSSSWLAQRDARIRVETLEAAAAAVEGAGCARDRRRLCHKADVLILRERARIERGESR